MTRSTARTACRPALRATLGLMALLAPLPLHAAIPAPVEAMVREAARSGDTATLDAVVKVAKATNPDDAAEIAALGAQLLAQAEADAAEKRKAELAERGILEGWSGEGQVGLGFSSGNTREASAVVGVALRKAGLYTRHKFTGTVDYLRSNGVTARQKYALDYSLDFILSEHLYLVGTLGWDRDRFAGYARRFTESFGVGYRAIDEADMRLDLEAGPALRQTRFIDDGNQDEFAARGSLAWKWTIQDGLALSQDGSALYTDSNTTLISNTALTAKLNGKLSTRLTFHLQKETDPPLGRKSTDTATRFMLVYDF
jgi:putative salt-induced outer membrane protein